MLRRRYVGSVRGVRYQRVSHSADPNPLVRQVNGQSTGPEWLTRRAGRLVQHLKILPGCDDQGSVTHLGIARMEAATWHPSLTVSLPPLPRAAHWALWGRLAVVVAVAVVLCLLALFGRTAPGRAYDPRGGGFNWTAIEPGSGRDVPRAEWIERAS